MPSATIVPKYVNQPKPGKKLGTIKDEAGELWLCSPALLNQFRVGQSTTIEYKTAPRDDGGEWRTITSGGGGSSMGSASPQSNGQTRQAQHPQDSENIFVCGVTNHAIAYQSFPLEAHELARLVKMARQAWQEGSKPLAAPTRAVPKEPDDMSDEIPF